MPASRTASSDDVSSEPLPSSPPAPIPASLKESKVKHLESPPSHPVPTSALPPPPPPAAIPPPLPPLPPAKGEVVVPMPEPVPASSEPVVLYMIPENTKVRHWFIFKVYMVLFAQLACVALMTVTLLSIEVARQWIEDHWWMYLVAVGVYFVLSIVLSCCDACRRKFPLNIILLLIFTLATGYMTAVLASYFTTWEILVAFGITSGSCLVVSLFSLQTKCDLTKWTGVLVIVTLALCIFGIVVGLTVLSSLEILHAVYAGIGALVFMLWLAIDTQLLLGSKKYALTPDDYVYAALQLFLDVMFIFWFLLTIVRCLCSR